MSAVPQPIPELPPQAILMQLISGKMVTQIIRAATVLGIPDMLRDKPRTADDLAAEAGVHGPSLYRLLRALTNFGIFQEQEDGAFALTPLAQLLRSDVPNSLRHMALMMGDEWQMRVWSDIVYSIRTGQPAIDHVLKLPAFTYFRDHPEQGAVFNAAMTDFSRLAVPAIVSAYDFSGLRNIMDVGGGHGYLLCGILNANPEARGTVYDLPEVIEGTRAQVAAQGLTERCHCQPGDFFASIQAGADAYVMKHIIHDWDDAKAAAILRQCREGLAEGGRVLVIEHVVPGRNEPSFAKLLDLEMLLIPGGKERTAKEFEELFASAGLKLNRIVPTQGPLAIIEGVAA